LISIRILKNSVHDIGAAALPLPQGQRPDKVTLNLAINGKGTVWIDDIVLSKEPLK
jgi:hypothetical protein